MEPDVTPSDIELELLKALWRCGPLSAREVHAVVAEQRGWATSTTRTVLERMRAKGLVERRSIHGVAVYEAARGRVEVLGGALRRLLRRVLEVRGDLPASAFSGSQVLSPDELAELERLLNRPDEDTP